MPAAIRRVSDCEAVGPIGQDTGSRHFGDSFLPQPGGGHRAECHRHAGSAEVLKAVAKGASRARVTKDAQSALDRLGKR
jgi:hypothetical protein